VIHKSILYFSLIISIFSCSNIRNKSTKQNRESSDTNQVTTTRQDFSNGNMQINQKIHGKIFMVKDSSKYATTFINELRDLCPEYESLKLIDDKLYLITKPFNGQKYVNSMDTYSIPSILPLNILIKYKAAKANKNYALFVKRINYTSIEYEFKTNNFVIKTGQCALSGGFILGFETELENDSSAYGVDEYLDKSNCWTIIRIEMNSGNKATFRVVCEKDKTKDILNIPILKKRIK
jgi:hypothetical protein